MISLIIPSRTAAHLDKLLTSIVASQPDWKEKAVIVVADDGLSGECKARYLDVLFVRCTWPFVFAKNVNVAASTALAMHPRSHIFILNDDTEIKSPRFIDELESLLPRVKAERWGYVGPRLLRNSVNGLQIRRDIPRDHIIDSPSCVPFVAVLIPNWVWVEIGPMDERFGANSYGFDDDAFYYKCKKAGYKVGITGSVVIDHDWHATFKEYGKDQLNQMLENARRIFEENYPDHGQRLPTHAA